LPTERWEEVLQTIDKSADHARRQKKSRKLAGPVFSIFDKAVAAENWTDWWMGSARAVSPFWSMSMFGSFAGSRIKPARFSKCSIARENCARSPVVGRYEQLIAS